MPRNVFSGRRPLADEVANRFLMRHIGSMRRDSGLAMRLNEAAGDDIELQPNVAFSVVVEHVVAGADSTVTIAWHGRSGATVVLKGVRVCPDGHGGLVLRYPPAPQPKPPRALRAAITAAATNLITTCLIVDAGERPRPPMT